MSRLPTGFSRFCTRGLLIAAAAACLAGFGAPSFADKANPEKLPAYAQADKPVMLVRGKAEILQLPGMAADVLVADPRVVDVQALQADRLYLVGLNVGDTNIIVLDDAGNVVRKFDVHVRIDTLAIQNMVNRLFPKEDVTVETIHDQLLVRGNVSSPAESNKITRLVASYYGDVTGQAGNAESIENLLNVAGDQQVMLRVKIMEASRNLFRELGVKTSIKKIGDSDDLITGVLGSIIDLPRPALATGALAIANQGNFGPVDIDLQTLEERGLVSILAEPNLTSISGELASFLAGGEIPVPTSRDSEGNVQVEYRPFGVRLSFRPTVQSDDRITMQLNSEVSSLNPANGVGAIPGLDTRNIQTTVELPSGGSLMIGGLLQSRAVKDMSGVPGIMSVPIIGSLMKSDSFARNETELIVIVTPYIVRPYAQAENIKEVATAPSAPLAKAFANNLRRVYKRIKLPDDILDSGQTFGYVFD